MGLMFVFMALFMAQFVFVLRSSSTFMCLHGFSRAAGRWALLPAVCGLMGL